MDTIASQITSLTIVYSTVYSGADKKNQTASLAFVRCKMFQFDDVIMNISTCLRRSLIHILYNVHASVIFKWQVNGDMNRSDECYKR